MMHRLITAALCLLTAGPILADPCDNLRNNQQAYRDCVNEWYGRSNRGSAPTPWWKSYDPNAESAPAEQPQNTGVDPYYARQREEAERKAAAQREEQARRAQAERDASSDKYFNTHVEAWETARRWLTVARVNALAAAAMKKATIAPADYSDLIVTAYPQWDLMHYWAEKAARQYGGRFNLLLALTETVGCPEHSQLELQRAGKPPECNPKYREEGLRRMQIGLNEAARVDRLLVCFKTYAWFREVPRYADHIPPESARRLPLYQACMASLGDISFDTGGDFVEAAFQTRVDVYRPDHFLLFFHPGRERLGSFTDTAAIQKLVRESALMMDLLSQPALEYQTKKRKEAAAAGLNLDWLDKAPALTLSPGPAAQRHIDLARSQLGQPAQAATAGVHRAHIAPRTDWADWGQTWILLNNMMVEYQNAGNPAMAAIIGDAALEFAEVAGPANNEHIHVTLNKLAVLFDRGGKQDAAEFLYRRAIAVQDAAGDPTALAQATYLSNLGNLLRNQKRTAEGAPFYRRALAILTPRWDQPDGPQSASAASALQRIGVLQRSLGDYAKAEETFNTVLDLRKRILPAGHNDIGLAYESKAILYRMTNRPAEAEQMQLEADIIYGKRKRPAAQPATPGLSPAQQTLWSQSRELEKRGAALYAAGKYSEAVAVFRDVLKNQLQLADNPADDKEGLDTAYYNLGMSLFKTKAYAEAESMLKQALAIREDDPAIKLDLAFYGTSVAGLHNRLRGLSALYAEQKKYAQAEPYARRILALLEKTRGPDDPETLRGLNSLGVNLNNQSRFDEAETLFKRGLATATKAGNTGEHATDLRENLAIVYRNTHRDREAEALLAATPTRP
jgi:tetratricopeptide (TPR) repeat protein